MTKTERQRIRRTLNKEKYRKYREENRSRYREYSKKYRSEHKDELKEYHRDRMSHILNAEGITKHHIRTNSNRILKRCHPIISGYEIHHCFGYDDPAKFIYIPRELHLKIHQFLRDNNIPAHIEHFNSIRELISSYPGYTYIHS